MVMKRAVFSGDRTWPPLPSGIAMSAKAEKTSRRPVGVSGAPDGYDQRGRLVVLEMRNVQPSQLPAGAPHPGRYGRSARLTAARIVRARSAEAA